MASKLNPVKVTIKPLAAYLRHIATTLPPNFNTHTAIELENRYKHLDIERVALWLDSGGMSEISRELKEKTHRLLVMLRKWESKGRMLGVYSVETFEALQDTDYDGYWGLRHDYDEIADAAASVSSWLIVVGNMIQSKLDSKADAAEIIIDCAVRVIQIGDEKKIIPRGKQWDFIGELIYARETGLVLPRLDASDPQDVIDWKHALDSFRRTVGDDPKVCRRIVRSGNGTYELQPHVTVKNRSSYGIRPTK